MCQKHAWKWLSKPDLKGASTKHSGSFVFCHVFCSFPRFIASNFTAFCHNIGLRPVIIPSIVIFLFSFGNLVLQRPQESVKYMSTPYSSVRRTLNIINAYCFEGTSSNIISLCSRRLKKCLQCYSMKRKLTSRSGSGGSSSYLQNKQFKKRNHRSKNATIRTSCTTKKNNLLQLMN